MISKKLKAAWLEALRGRGYRQTTGTLQSTKDKRKYCCLGVLCRVAQRIEGFDPVLKDNNILSGGELSDQGFNVLTAEEESKLVDMNDDDRASFRKIADWIEANIKGFETTQQ